jgi:hypothetical protein
MKRVASYSVRVKNNMHWGPIVGAASSREMILIFVFQLWIEATSTEKDQTSAKCKRLSATLGLALNSHLALRNA